MEYNSANLPGLVCKIEEEILLTNKGFVQKCFSNFKIMINQSTGLKQMS